MERSRAPCNSLCVLLILLVTQSSFLNVRYEKYSNSYITTQNYVEASKIVSPQQYQGDLETWGVFFQGSPVPHDFSPVTAKLVEARPIHACSKLENYEEVKDAIVLIDADDCDPQQKAKHAQDAGAIGIIIKEYSWHPALTYITDGKKHPDLVTPTVQISTHKFNNLIKWMKEDNVTIELSADPNPWDETYGNKALWNAHMAFVVVGFSIVIALACRRLWHFWSHGEKAKTKQAVLVLVVVYSIVVVLGWIDVIGTRGIWSYRVSTLISSLYFPFGLTTYFLLALYWGNIANRQDFSKLKKPFWVCSIVFFAAEFGSWPPRYLLYQPGLILTILLAMYVISFAFATIFYLKNGIQFYQMVAGNAFLTRTRQVKRVTFHIIMIASLNGLMVLMFLTYLIVGIGPIANACIYWIHAALMLLIAFFEVQMFPQHPTREQAGVELPTLNYVMGAPTQSSTLSSTDVEAPATLAEANEQESTPTTTTQQQ